jgi:multidrug efflux pump subunit AcrA (membrane-fusion protein)
MSMRSHSIVFNSALCIALPCLVFTGCKDKQAESAPIATASVAPVTRGDLSSTLTVAGEFQPYQEVELHAKVSGYIRRINVDIGDRVKSGQVIATLEVPELSAQVSIGLIEAPAHRSDLKIEVFMEDEVYLILPPSHRWTKETYVPGC